MTNKVTNQDNRPETIEIEGDFYRDGDFIKIQATPGKRDGFYGKIRGWHVTDGGVVTALDIWGGPRDLFSMRTIQFDRTERLGTRMQNKLLGAEDEFYSENGRKYPFNPNSAARTTKGR